MAELLVRGAGRSPQSPDRAVAAQVAWAGHRRRKVKAHAALGNQVLGQLDLVFPGLGAWFDGILGAKAGRVILREVVEPERIRRLGVEGLRRYVGRRGVRLSRPRAAQILSAAREVLRLPEQQLAALRPVLAADVALLDGLDAEILRAEEELALVLPATPAAVLVTLPGVAVVRASNYGAEIGDPWRFRNADAAYRFSGLVPTSYESAGKARPGQRISREGSVELREAILELGRGLAQHDPDFGAY
jgi:transposase